MTAILHDEPPALPEVAGVPPALQRVLRHCLEKDPADRFQSARDLAFDLEGVLEGPAGAASLRADRSRASGRLGTLLAAVALALALPVVFVAGRWWSPGEPHQALETHRLTDFSGLEEFPAVSPDLKSVAFTARVNGHRQIFVRLLAGGPPLPITKDDV